MFQIPTDAVVGDYSVSVSVDNGEAAATARASFTVKPQANIADVNGDGVVNILDIALVAHAWSSTPGSPRWDPRCDLDGSGVINIIDITIVARQFRR
jgi:hypothetical protein